jgi:hypothetical protein
LYALETRRIHDNGRFHLDPFRLLLALLGLELLAIEEVTPGIGVCVRIWYTSPDVEERPLRYRRPFAFKCAAMRRRPMGPLPLPSRNSPKILVTISDSLGSISSFFFATPARSSAVKVR